MRICHYCNNEFPDTEINRDIGGNDICKVCTENIREVSTSIKIFEKSGIYQYLWSEQFGFTEKDTNKMVIEIPGIVYMNNTLRIKVGFTAIVSKWIIELGDNRFLKFMTFMKSLASRSIIPPIPIIISMSQIGNLRMEINVVIRESDAGKFREWMGSENNLKLN